MLHMLADPVKKEKTGNLSQYNSSACMAIMGIFYYVQGLAWALWALWRNLRREGGL